MQKSHTTVWVVYVAIDSNPIPLTDDTDGFLGLATEFTEITSQHNNLSMVNFDISPY